MARNPVAPTAPPGAAAIPPTAEVAARPAGWTGGRVAAVVIGGVLVLVSLALLGAGGTALWADLTQRDAGYVTTDVHQFSTSGSALATESTHLGSAGVGWLYSPSLLGKVRIRVTPANSASALFVGIGRSRDVDRYLAGVNHTHHFRLLRGKDRGLGGGTPRSAPGTQHFWVASSTGRGARTLTWDPHGGSWTVVVMNAERSTRTRCRRGAGSEDPGPPVVRRRLAGSRSRLPRRWGAPDRGCSAPGRRVCAQWKVKSCLRQASSLAAPHVLTGRLEEADRYAGIKQYSLAKILAVWAAAALPMGILAWVVGTGAQGQFFRCRERAVVQGAACTAHGRADLAVRARGRSCLVGAANLPLVDGARGALASVAAEPTQRGGRRQALVDRDPVPRPVHRRGAAPRVWARRIAIWASSSTPQSGRASSAATGGGTPSSSCCSCSTRCSGRSSSSADCSCRA